MDSIPCTREEVGWHEQIAWTIAFDFPCKWGKWSVLRPVSNSLHFFPHSDGKIGGFRPSNPFMQSSIISTARDGIDSRWGIFIPFHVSEVDDDVLNQARRSTFELEAV